MPDLTPQLVLELVRAHLNRRGYSDIQVVPLGGSEPARSDVGAPVVQAAVSAARAVYEQEPLVYPSHGGSGPMYDLVQGLGSNAVMAGVGYAGMRMHAPNENIRLADYFKHIAFLVEFMRRFAVIGENGSLDTVGPSSA